MPDGHRYFIAKGRLFSPDTHQYYKPGRFTKKQKRHYMRLKSGLTLGTYKKERLCFLTLSTKYEVVKVNGIIVKINGKSVPLNPRKRLTKMTQLNYAFTKLKQKIQRYIQKQMYERFCKKKHLQPYKKSLYKQKAIKYPQIHECFKFKLRYFKVKTDEGGGVLHIVFRKGYNVPKIPFIWLQNQWIKIWGSHRVHISQIKVRNSQKLSLYLVGQYFAKQPVIRMSYGHYWVYHGFVKSFKHIIEVYGFKRAIEIWDKRMKNNDLPTSATTRQTRFRWRKLKPIPKPKALYKKETLQSTFETSFINGKVRLFLRNRYIAISQDSY